MAFRTRRSSCRRPYPHRIRCHMTSASPSPHPRGSPVPPPLRRARSHAHGHPPRGWTFWQLVAPIWSSLTALFESYWALFSLNS